MKRIYNGIVADIFLDMPEPQIKYMLLYLLQCEDVSAEDKAEALQLLELSETALTAEQIKQIDFLLLD